MQGWSLTSLVRFMYTCLSGVKVSMEAVCNPPAFTREILVRVQGQALEAE